MACRHGAVVGQPVASAVPCGRFCPGGGPGVGAGVHRQWHGVGAAAACGFRRQCRCERQRTGRPRCACWHGTVQLVRHAWPSGRAAHCGSAVASAAGVCRQRSSRIPSVTTHPVCVGCRAVARAPRIGLIRTRCGWLGPLGSGHTLCIQAFWRWHGLTHLWFLRIRTALSQL